jgi:hypothetical protein
MFPPVGILHFSIDMVVNRARLTCINHVLMVLHIVCSLLLVPAMLGPRTLGLLHWGSRQKSRNNKAWKQQNTLPLTCRALWQALCASMQRLTQLFDTAYVREVHRPTPDKLSSCTSNKGRGPHAPQTMTQLAPHPSRGMPSQPFSAACTAEAARRPPSEPPTSPTPGCCRFQLQPVCTAKHISTTSPVPCAASCKLLKLSCAALPGRLQCRQRVRRRVLRRCHHAGLSQLWPRVPLTVVATGASHSCGHECLHRRHAKCSRRHPIASHLLQLPLQLRRNGHSCQTSADIPQHCNAATHPAVLHYSAEWPLPRLHARRAPTCLSAARKHCMLVRQHCMRCGPATL